MEADHTYVSQSSVASSPLPFSSPRALACARLLMHRADSTAPMSDGRAPLLLASEQGSLACVRRLVAAQARVDQAAGDGVAAMHLACAGGHHLVALHLLEHRARADQVASDGTTPLFGACASGTLQSVVKTVNLVPGFVVSRLTLQRFKYTLGRCFPIGLELAGQQIVVRLGGVLHLSKCNGFAIHRF